MQHAKSQRYPEYIHENVSKVLLKNIFVRHFTIENTNFAPCSRIIQATI